MSYFDVLMARRLGGGASSADKVSYDGTESGLSAVTVQAAIDELAAEKCDMSVIAGDFDSTKSYNFGEYVIYDEKLYACSAATTGAWDVTKWRTVTVGEVLTNLRGVLNPLTDVDAVADLVKKGELLDVMKYGDEIVFDWENGSNTYEFPMHFCHLETVKDENDNDVNVADFECSYVLPIDTVYDAAEAIYSSETDLPAGDYYFKIVGDSWGNNTGKYVSFTLTETLTAGKQIRKKSGGYNVAIEDCTLGIFASGSDLTGTVLAFAVSTTQPETGINLGKTDGSADCNAWACVALGYNRWKYSAIRQYLNADTTAGNWWAQQHKWDVMPAYANTANGFLYGLPASVKARIKTTKIITARNTVYNSGDTPLGGFDETFDKVFLASLEQMYIEPQVEGEGSVWEYYSWLNGTSTKWQRGQTYPALIMYDISNIKTARYRWLRSCSRGTATYAFNVTASGGVSSSIATSGYRSAPCLRIG